MWKTVTSVPEFNAVMGLLNRILDTRIAFFDIQGCEQEYIDMKPMAPYCGLRRQDPEFNQTCIRCDRSHLLQAKKKSDILIYHCHEGLLEGIVPLYGRRGGYLGAIVYGQMRDKARPGLEENVSSAFRQAFLNLPEYSAPQVHDIGRLLKYVSEYIITHELLRLRHKPWVNKLERYIETHLERKITLAELADVIDKSPSFVSHHFKAEFGRSPKEYMLHRRMEEARTLLETGRSVQQTAARMGFYDAFHFSKTYKSYWGESPKHHRR